MNIKQAKEQIKIAMQAYFSKDAFGNYRIPIEKQRPIFLMGPPGVGKTAIMEQIAQELGVGLVMGRYRTMKLLGGMLRVINIPDSVYRVFAMSGLEGLGVLR